MSKIVAIITEYNPFHNGHKYQIDKIKDEIPDAIIISIMSGNVVQRGEFAFVDKYTRAEMALNCGVDAVFELPFPYSCATAEIFASAGVEIASKLGAQMLYFGIENTSLTDIERAANALDTKEFEDELSIYADDKKMSYAVKREKALARLGIGLTKHSNDMLAIEYIRAIKNKKLFLEYRSINRVGSSYNDTSVCEIMSAGGIRKHFYKNGKILSVPQSAKEVITNDISNGRFNDLEKTNCFILANTILSSKDKLDGLFDVPNGMGCFLYDCAKKCENSNSFTEGLSSKSYTNARLKRALIYNIFDVTEIDKEPKFTMLLGANDKGKKIIKKSSKESFDIITKHRDSIKMCEKDRIIYERCLKVDRIFATLLKNPCAPNQAYKKVPYIL